MRDMPVPRQGLNVTGILRKGMTMKRVIGVLAILALLGVGASAQSTDRIVSEITIDAPVEAVWAAWTTSDGLRAWLAPHAEIDLRVGGLMRTNYKADGALGDPGTIENTILSFEPQRMLSIKVAKAPAAFPFPNAIQTMWTVLYFEPEGADRTRLRAVGLGFGPDEESQKMRAFFEKGNEFTLKQLQSHLSKKPR